MTSFKRIVRTSIAIAAVITSIAGTFSKASAGGGFVWPPSGKAQTNGGGFVWPPSGK